MIRLSKSVIGEEEKKAVQQVLDTEFLGYGPEVFKFEEALERYLGGGVSVACVSTGTAALHLALQAIGVGTGDEVLVPAITFVASFQAVSATGAVAIPCEIEEASGLIDLEDAMRRVTKKTKGIMPVHYASQVCDLKKIYAFSEKYGIRVIEDAAHAFGCLYKGKKVGSLGDVVCFSFDGIKNITSGEGGAVVSGDKHVIMAVKDARLLGIKGDNEKHKKQGRSWEFDVTGQGWRYHMSNIMAAIGRVQLQRFEKEFKPKRVDLGHHYNAGLRKVGGIGLFPIDLESVVPHIFPIRILGGKRDHLRDVLISEGVQAGIHYKPNHLLSKFGRGYRLPIAEKFYEEILTLPMHPDLTFNEVEKIVDIIETHI